MARAGDALTGDTIYALSSGSLPAAIAIVRISGPAAGVTVTALAGALPAPRRAVLRDLRTPAGSLLDRALLLWFPGPNSATGDDLAELHIHGGRAVVDAVLGALGSLGLRHAEPGEFTRRALLNGRLDLSEAEGLADLLAAETESQRREALDRAGGALSRLLDGWTTRLVAIAAAIEAAIDHDGEDEVALPPPTADIERLAAEIAAALARPPAERLRDGVRVVIVGEPNAGKSSLFNALIGRDAAIVSTIPGTTRDSIERPIAIGGVPMILIDTAGLRATDDPIEREGVARTHRQVEQADLVVDLSAGAYRSPVIAVSAMIDVVASRPDTIGVSAVTGEGLDHLRSAIRVEAAAMLPREGEIALDRRYRASLSAVRTALVSAAATADLVLAAEHVRVAREALDRLTGRAGFEDVLDALFGRFCLGK